MAEMIAHSLTSNRREILGLLAGMGIPSLAGCNDSDDAPHLSITARSISVEREGEQWVAALGVEVGGSYPGDEAAFHDVTVHAYDEERTEVCSEKLGTVTTEHSVNNLLQVSLSCSRPPRLITFSAAESPCADDTNVIIHVASYDAADGWCSNCNRRQCGEGLPPEPPDDTPGEVRGSRRNSLGE